MNYKEVIGYDPSSYQVEAFDFILNGKGNGVINAVAGSGKSTTIVSALNIIPKNKKILFLAFNKDITDELILKVFSSKELIAKYGAEEAIKLATNTMFQSNVTIRTLHSFGFNALKQANPGLKIEIDSSKYKKYVIQLCTTYYGPNFNWDMLTAILKLVDLMRLTFIKEKEWVEKEIILKHGIDIPVEYSNETLIEIANKAISIGSKEIKKIDFTDMIFLPVLLNLKTFKYDFVFVDECQDLNTTQRKLMLKCMKPRAGRFIAVGDPRQAIYGFAGADVKSFEQLKSIPNTKELFLSICYRCDSEIIKLAKHYVPQIEGRKDIGKGEFIEIESSVIKDGDMVLCRFNAPLIEMCYRFIREGRAASIKGKDIGLNLIEMIDKIKDESIEGVITHLKLDLEKIYRKLCTKMPPDEAESSMIYINSRDKLDCIIEIAAFCNTKQEIIDRIKTIFSDNVKGIMLSSIHKSKGLENDRVFILQPSVLPLYRSGMKGWQFTQEKNLHYVAITRAKHFLGYIVESKKEDQVPITY